MTDYKNLGLKAGLEIHQQLDTKHKLFCNCSTSMQEKIPLAIVKRKLHPVASELGEVDIAAQFEYLKDRTFHYQTFYYESCLVELDEEPPHPLNTEALHIGLQIALLFNCHIPSEIQVMRKTVIDGSNTSGFQRTAVIGLNGYMEYKGKKVPISQVSLEEDAAAIVKEEGGHVTYRLNRLGVPLVEIGTGLLVEYTPEEIQEIAYMIGITCRSTGKTRRGIGSIRQDMNVSISKGARVEIKGVQELGMIAKVIENEIKRQLSENVREETRVANPDGTTKFMRPLPGANRMYPETDIPPVPIATLAGIKKTLPESLTRKLHRFQAHLKLSPQLAREILASEYLDVFEKLSKKVEPSVVASTFTSILKDLERSGVDVENITENNFTDLFENLAKKKITKETLPEILKSLAQNNTQKVSDIAKRLGFVALTETELEKIVKEVISEFKGKAYHVNKILGIVMSQVRGRTDFITVSKVVMREIAKVEKWKVSKD